MTDVSRRAVVAGACGFVAAAGLSGCTSVGGPPRGGFGPYAMRPPPGPPPLPPPAPAVAATPEVAVAGESATVYGAVAGDRFPIPAVPLSQVDPAFLRARVAYASSEPPGTVVIDPKARYLYHVLEGGRAMRYGVGVGREGFGWSGVATIHDKQEWPDWYPPKEMIQRQPEIRKHLTELQGGIGMPGGPRNPLGARAMYLWQNNKDTLYRIHGTSEPWTVGTSVSSGCIRMINQDVIDLYAKVPVGTKVVVLGA